MLMEVDDRRHGCGPLGGGEWRRAGGTQAVIASWSPTMPRLTCIDRPGDSLGDHDRGRVQRHDGTTGMIDASTTRSPDSRLTAPCVSTTAQGSLGPPIGCGGSRVP